MSFDKQLAIGLLGESHIARWLNGRGWNILPAYQTEIHTGKGPRLFMATHKQLVTPDMLAFRTNEIRWFEAKTKSAFAWNRQRQEWVTGIDKRHWLDYIEVNRETGWPLWILFLHKPGYKAKDTPPGKISPSGLYGQDVMRLIAKLNHESDRHGSSGMVYWLEKDLLRICDYDVVVR